MVSYALIDSGGSELWVANSRDDDPIWFQFCTHTQFCEECAIIYILHIVCQAYNTTIYIKQIKFIFGHIIFYPAWFRSPFLKLLAVQTWMYLILSRALLIKARVLAVSNTLYKHERHNRETKWPTNLVRKRSVDWGIPQRPEEIVHNWRSRSDEKAVAFETVESNPDPG